MVHKLLSWAGVLASQLLGARFSRCRIYSKVSVKAAPAHVQMQHTFYTHEAAL